MSNQFLKLRRSAVQGKIPETSSLDLGELAINTYDGQLFLKKSGSQGEIVTVVGSTGSFTGSFTGNGAGLINIPATGITGLNLSRIATGSVSASVSNTNPTASFRLTSGSNTLLNITKDGYVWIGNGTVSNQAYQLDIQGSGRFTANTQFDDSAAAITIPSNTAYISMNGNQKFIGNANSLIVGGTEGLGIRATAIVFGNGSIGYHYFKNDYALFSTSITGGATNLDTNAPSGSAVLEIRGINKGFLPTRTNSTASITSPAQGLLTYITASGDVEGLWQYRTGSNGWVQFLHNSSSIPASSVVGLNLSRISTGSITASVSTDVTASFRLTSGSNTLLNVTKDGYVWIGNGAVSNQAYQLDVQGTVRTTGDAVINKLNLQADGKIWYSNIWGERWALNMAGDGDLLLTSTKGSQNITFRGESTYTHIIASSNVASSIYIGKFEGREGFIAATQNANTGNYTTGSARICAGYTPGTVSAGATNTNGVPLYINPANGGGSGFIADIIFQTVASAVYGASDTHQLVDRWFVKGNSGTLSNVSNPPSASLYVSGSFILNGTQFNNTSSVTSAGITTISQLSTSSYTSCFYNYTVASASNARSGQVMTVWNGNTIKYTEVVTTDIGDTNQVIVSASLSSGFVRLQVSASSGWTFKNISNLL